jgi:hypothetical protein
LRAARITRARDNHHNHKREDRFVAFHGLKQIYIFLSFGLNCVIVDLRGRFDKITQEKPANNRREQTAFLIRKK